MTNTVIIEEINNGWIVQTAEKGSIFFSGKVDAVLEIISLLECRTEVVLRLSNKD